MTESHRKRNGCPPLLPCGDIGYAPVGLPTCGRIQQKRTGTLPPPETCGWLKHEHAMYTCDWESSEIQSRVKDTIDLGYTCKRGCRNNQCGSRKRGNLCGPGCQCQGCTNANTGASTERELSESETETESEDDFSTCADECVQTEVVTDFDDMTYDNIIS